jgi:Rrf2 family protein
VQVVLGSRGDYTVRAVLYLARHPGRRRRREISDAMEIPDKFLPQILGALVRAGIAKSTVGRVGGYELARPAEDVSLREVVEVAEGPIRSQKCVLRGGPCYWGEKCAVHDAWLDAETALSERLTRTTFAELARADWDIELERRASGVPLDAPRPERLHRDATTGRQPR